MTCLRFHLFCLILYSLCVDIICLIQDVKKFMPVSGISFNMQQEFLKQIETSFGNVEEVQLFAAATLLDPRFKKFGFTKAEDDFRAPVRIAKAISTVCKSLCHTHQPSFLSFEHEDIVVLIACVSAERVKEAMAKAEADAAAAALLDDAPQVDQAQRDQDDEDSFWADFDREVEAEAAAHSGQDMAGGIPVQLRQYLDTKPVKRKLNPEPLKAWEQFKGEYPYVYQVAQEYLSILATSVPAERLFSHAGWIAHQRRTRLASKRLSMLIFLRSIPEELWFN